MLRYEGDGEFKPAASYWAKQADRDFVVGMTYRLVEHQERSTATHNHYFAAINEAAVPSRSPNGQNIQRGQTSQRRW